MYLSDSQLRLLGMKLRIDKEDLPTLVDSIQEMYEIRFLLQRVFRERTMGYIRTQPCAWNMLLRRR